MTQIEMQVANSTITANRAITRSLETTDWGQRRYETARDFLPYAAKTVSDVLLKGQKVEGAEGKTVMQVTAEVAVRYADALMDELKKTK